MAQADVIKEFLVSLGFKVNSDSYNKFNNAVTGSTSLAEGLGKTATAAVLSTTAAVAAVSSAMDKLYFVSQRTGSSVSDIKSFNFAVSQTGGSAEAAQQSLENLGNFIKFTPGSANFLENIGVAPEHVHDAAKAMLDLKRSFQDMEPYLQKAYGDVLGIDVKTLLSITSGEFNKNIDSYNKRLADAGVNADEAARKGKEFMTALRGVGASAAVAGAALQVKFADPLKESIGFLDSFLIGLSILASDSDRFEKNLKNALGLNDNEENGLLSFKKGHFLPDYFYTGTPEKEAPKKRSGTLSDQVQASALSLVGPEGIQLSIPSTDPSLYQDEKDYKLFSGETGDKRHGVTVNQTNHINVSGAGNPESVGASVARHQNSAMQNAYRLGMTR